jgi:hypothetical protein
MLVGVEKIRKEWSLLGEWVRGSFTVEVTLN